LLPMAMTAKEHPYSLNFGPLPEEIVRADSANPLRPATGAGSPEEVAAAALASVEKTLAEHGPDTFAAMVIEPIQGEGGFVVPAPGFLKGLRKIADKYGIVLVLDEIQDGMGRSVTLYASWHVSTPGDMTH